MMMMMAATQDDEPAWITASAAARSAKVSVQTMTRWLMAYDGLGRKVGGRWRVYQDGLAAMLAGRLVKKSGTGDEDDGQRKLI